ncbi:DnaJ domain-containing protein [Halorarius halobius]|uniref:DnaJ domain-containing protein n=1 Tax=Halorarius halobius TaxID=2962671 RepID=UPI0020CFA018|nr:DnaJ domain-containing protein [Halorarius halobius]
MGESYYELLGVSPDASRADIEAAFRERAKETHPDRSDAPDAAERFQAVRRAREVLTDPDERARYDRLGHAAFVGDAPVGSHEATAATDPGRGGHDAGEGHTATADSEARTDGHGGTEEWWREYETRFDRDHAAENRSTSWYRPGADGGEDGYRVSPATHRGIRFTTERIGFAVVALALYPVLVGSAFLPAFPVFVNVLLGLCALALTVTLLSVPEAGVLVFGGWTLLAPVALSIAGVGLLSILGTVVWAFCWIPFAIAAANLLFQRA